MALPTSTREYYWSVLGDYSGLKTREAPLRALSGTEVLVKIHAVSLQYRDLLVAKDQYPWKLIPNLVPMSDMGGQIIAVGPKTTLWKVGDRVCAKLCADHFDGPLTQDIIDTCLGASSDGVLTEYKVFQSHALVAFPDHLSYEEASTLPCAALTAYNSLNGPIPVKAGDIVLVLGTGGVSIFGLQFAVAAGATVIATSSSDDKLKIAIKLGAKHGINYNTTPQWDEEVLRLTDGRGVDHVFETGGPETTQKSLNATRIGGNVHIIGATGGLGGPLPPITPTTLMKTLIVRGVLMGGLTQFNDMNRMLAMNRGAETMRPVIDRVFAFKDVVEAYRYLESQKHVGKIVVKISED